MKVAFLVGGFPDDKNPVHGVFNYRAVKGLKNFDDIDVEVFRVRVWRPGRKFIESYTWKETVVHQIFVPMIPYWWSNIEFNILISRYIGWEIIKRKLKVFDIIHSVGISFLGVIASHWGSILKIPHITQVIGSDLVFQIPRIKNKRFVRQWSNWLHGAVCTSEYLKKLFKTHYQGVPNVTTIYRGTDLKFFNPKGEVAYDLYNLQGIKFLYMGGFPYYSDLPHGDDLKGGRTLLKIWNIVDTKMLSMRKKPYLIIGGPYSTQNWIFDWKENLKNKNNVIILGQVDPQNMAKIYRSVDVVLVPSFSEGMPNVAVEASACGKPVFASNVGGIPELIENRKNGLLIPAGDINKWVDAIIKFSSKKDILKRMGQYARGVVELKFNDNDFAIKLRKLYKKVLDHEHKS